MGWKVIPITLGQGVRPMGSDKVTVTSKLDSQNAELIRQIQQAALPINISQSAAVNLCITWIRLFADRGRLDLAMEETQVLQKLSSRNIKVHHGEPLPATPAKSCEQKERKSA